MKLKADMDHAPNKKHGGSRGFACEYEEKKIISATKSTIKTNTMVTNMLPDFMSGGKDVCLSSLVSYPQEVTSLLRSIAKK